MMNTNMYGFDTTTPESTGIQPIPAGINENCRLTSISYEPAKEGSQNMCLAFYFEDSAGGVLRHVEWPIDIAQTKEQAVKQGENPEEFVAKRFRSQGIRIKHILTKIMPEEQAVLSGVTTFEQFAQGVVNLTRNSLPSGNLRLKVLLNNKDYSTLPPYAPFVEKQTEEPTKLRIGKGERITPTKKSSLDMPDSGDGVDTGDNFDDPPF